MLACSNNNNVEDVAAARIANLSRFVNENGCSCGGKRCECALCLETMQYECRAVVLMLSSIKCDKSFNSINMRNYIYAINNNAKHVTYTIPCSATRNFCVCKGFFCIFWGIASRTLATLVKQLRENVKKKDMFRIRTHALKGKTGSNANRSLDEALVKKVREHVHEYAEKYGSRVKFSKNTKTHVDGTPIKYLPFGVTNDALFIKFHKWLKLNDRSFYLHYATKQNKISEEQQQLLCADTTHDILDLKIWKPLLGKTTFNKIVNGEESIKRQNKPRSDCCNVCVSLQTSISNLRGEDRDGFSTCPIVRAKLEALETEVDNHLSVAEMGRDLYRHHRAEVKGERFEDTLMLSIDMAQLRSIYQPQDEPNRMYYYSFPHIKPVGIVNENTGKLVTYLIAEGESGKGSDLIMSCIMLELQRLGGEYTDEMINKVKTLRIQFDNCPGQGKNAFIMASLQWLLLSNNPAMPFEFEIAAVEFMIAGHTYFMPDTKFSHESKHLKKSIWAGVSDMADVLNSRECKCTGYCNCSLAIPIKNEDVKKYREIADTYFSKKFKNIAKYHRFVMRKSSPGTLWCCEEYDSYDDLSKWESFQLWGCTTHTPEQLFPISGNPSPENVEARKFFDTIGNRLQRVDKRGISLAKQMSVDQSRGFIRKELYQALGIRPKKDNKALRKKYYDFLEEKKRTNSVRSRSDAKLVTPEKQQQKKKKKKGGKIKQNGK